MVQVVYCLNDKEPPLSLEILVLDSALVLWRKGEKEFAKIEKILKFNANKQV